MADVRVLFVCTANICRSAYAHVRAADLLAGRPGVQLESAGTWGFASSPMDAEMAAQLAARGVDASWFRSQRLTGDHVSGADVILTASAEHRSFIVDDWPSGLRKTFTLGQFAEALKHVAPSVGGVDLVDAARATRVTALRPYDVEDPYGRGTAAAAACAARLDGLLAAILPKLASPLAANPSPESA